MFAVLGGGGRFRTSLKCSPHLSLCSILSFPVCLSLVFWHSHFFKTDSVLLILQLFHVVLCLCLFSHVMDKLSCEFSGILFNMLVGLTLFSSLFLLIILQLVNFLLQRFPSFFYFPCFCCHRIFVLALPLP